MATFGYTSQGASSLSLGSSGAGTIMQAGKFTLSASGSATKVTAWVKKRTSNILCIGAIYADSAGSPGALIAASSSVSVTSASFSQVDFPLSAALTPGDYWLACLSDADNTGVGGDIACDVAGGFQAERDGIPYAAPDPFGAPDFTNVERISVYATYSPPFVSQNAYRDENGFSTVTAALNTDGKSIVRVYANPSNNSLKVSDGSSGSDHGPQNAPRDGNHIPAIMAASSADGVTPVTVYADSSGNLLIQST